MKKTITTMNAVNASLMLREYGKAPDCIKSFKKAVRLYGYYGKKPQHKVVVTDKYRIKEGQIDFSSGTTFWLSYEKACVKSLIDCENGKDFDEIPLYQYAIACAKSILKGALDPERMSVLKKKREKGIACNSGFSPAIQGAFDGIARDTYHLSEIEYLDGEIGIHFDACDVNGNVKKKPLTDYEKDRENRLNEIISHYSFSDGYDVVQEAVALIYEQWNRYHIIGDTANIFDIPIKYRYINRNRQFALEKLVDPYEIKAWNELIKGFYQEKEVVPHKIILKELGAYVRNKSSVKFDNNRRCSTFDFTLWDLLLDRSLQIEEGDSEYITKATESIKGFSEDELNEILFCNSINGFYEPPKSEKEKERKPLCLSLLAENVSVDEIAKKCGIKKPFHIAVFKLQCSGVGSCIIYEKLKKEFNVSLSEIEKQITRNKAKIREKYHDVVREIEREKARKKAKKQ